MASDDYRSRRHDVAIGAHRLEGFLSIPDKAHGIVIFVHGSGSSRHSSRNTHVAAALHERRFATLLFDLLTLEEGKSRKNVFDIGLLGARILEAVQWSIHDNRTRHLPIGLFGASTGAAAALQLAARAPGRVAAIVSRGGRPDLAGNAALSRVFAPTLLIVGGDDREVLALNEWALGQLPGTRALEVVPGASHLFEEPGALESVARLTADWFARHLGAAGQHAAD